MKKIIPFLSVAVLIIAWHFATSHNLVSSFFFPRIEILIQTGKELFTHDQFGLDILYSTLRVVSSFLISLLLASLLGSLLYVSPFLNRLVQPYTTFMRYLPVEALLPLIILFLGLGEAPKIGLLLIGTFFPLLSLIVKELHQIPGEIHDLAHVLGFGKLKRIVIYFRHIMPSIYENARIIIGWCRGYVVIAEMVATDHGIGYAIWQAQKYANMPKVYIAIITLGLIGFLMDYAFRKLKPFVFPYLYK